jgi:hypothetical protein
LSRAAAARNHTRHCIIFILFFFLGRDSHGVEEEIVAPFSISFPSFLITGIIRFEIQVEIVILL